jgi:choline dehydrogenase-like flavoprotein
MEWLAQSEDLPDLENRVTIDGRRTRLAMTRNNLESHGQLVRRMKETLRRAGFPIVLAKSLAGGGTSHQCGTVRMGSDPATSALDPHCRSWDQRNLFVVDASFFPSSAAVNPGLTIAAQALRVADHMLETEFRATRRIPVTPGATPSNA